MYFSVFTQCSCQQIIFGHTKQFGKIFDFNSKDTSGNVENYRVLLQQQTDELVRVTVRDGNGQPLPQLDADRLLRRIKANLL